MYIIYLVRVSCNSISLNTRTMKIQITQMSMYCIAAVELVKWPQRYRNSTMLHRPYYLFLHYRSELRSTINHNRLFLLRRMRCALVDHLKTSFANRWLHVFRSIVWNGATRPGGSDRWFAIFWKLLSRADCQLFCHSRSQVICYIQTWGPVLRNLIFIESDDKIAAQDNRRRQMA